MFLDVIYLTEEENCTSYYQSSVIAKGGLGHEFGNEEDENVDMWKR